MKTKHMLIISAALVVAFLTAQSFYSNHQVKNIPVKWYRYPQVRAGICAPVFNEADSAIEIPALKGWGNYKWKVSAATDSAQYYFNQGINMYYAFHSIEAIASFEKATRLDPDCAMAWYGKSLAMGPTINYPNGYAPPTGAYEASVKSRELNERLYATGKNLITAMQQRYSSDTTLSVRQLRTNYAAAMKQVYARYPKQCRCSNPVCRCPAVTASLGPLPARYETKTMDRRDPICIGKSTCAFAEAPGCKSLLYPYHGGLGNAAAGIKKRACAGYADALSVARYTHALAYLYPHRRL
jgi:hypothetical protein